MEMKISILLPTRKRPAFMREVFETAMYTAAVSANLQFVFYIDNDDIESLDTALSLKARAAQILGTVANFHWNCVKFVTGDRIVLSEMWNRCAKEADADIMMHCGDDIRFRTPGWDMDVLNAFNKVPDKILFVYGNDGIQPDSFGTHGFIHRNWMKTVGYFVPPYFASDYNDTWLNEVSCLINRHQHIDIMTEHMHPVAGKHFWDQTHLDRLKRHQDDQVDQRYTDLLPERMSDAAKLQAYIDNYNKTPFIHYSDVF